MGDLHSGMQIRSGGATRADVEKMLKKADANGDGTINQAELEGLANQGRATGFSDQSSFELFGAGLDAAALAEIKSRESGQQFTPEYLDGTMKPFLAREWGTASAARATDLIAQQGSRELTRAGAEGLGNQTKLDGLQRNAGQQVLGKDAVMVDQGDGRVDADDVVLRPNAKGGYDREVLGQERADKINDVAGIRRGMQLLEGGPYFPNNPGNPDWATRGPNGPKAEWMNGGDPNGPWRMEKIPAGQDGAGFNEFKLDTSRMSATQALDHIAKNPKNYCMDCAMGKQVMQYQRLRERLGDEKFNDLANKYGMTIGHSGAALQNGLLAETSQRVPGTTTNMPLDQYQAGWGGYAKVSVSDPALAKDLEAMGWSGEHFTVGLDDRGNKVVTAHPFGTIPLEKFDADLRQKISDQSGGRVAPKDVVITYSRPVEFQLSRAREL